MKTTVQQHQQLCEILSHYPLEVSRLEVLQNHGSLVARVETPAAPYVLRVCYPWDTLERVQEELAWLLALHRDTDLIAPVPLPNEQGELVTLWAGGGLEPVRYCVLFTWVEGDSVRHAMSQETARAVGALIACLHRHARTYTPAHEAAFVGRRLDRDRLIGPASWWSSGRALQDLGSDTCARLAPAIDLAVEAMTRLGDAPEHFGIIHADLHFENILVHNNRCALIDFGDYSLGYYLHDLAITERAFRSRFDEHIITAFHEGYCQERNIPLATLRDLDAFMIAAEVVFLEWILSTDIVEARDLLLPQVPQRIERMLASAERARRMI